MAKEAQMIEFDAELLEELKQTYQRATEAGVDPFVFHSVELTLDYTKYLIEYLEGVIYANN